ncbi:MAG: class I SAM-dependent methyltransferase [Terriglobales bacterium]
MLVRSQAGAWALAATLILALTAAGCTARGNAAVAHEYDLDYAIAHGPLLTAPSPFLVAMLRHAARQRSVTPAALDIGSGSGRNTLYLARRGYAVTAVDLSSIGLALTAQQAKSGGLAVTTVRQDINQFDFGRNRFNLVLLIDFPFPYQTLLPKIAAALKPGGMVIVQDVSTREPGTVSPDGALHYTFMNRADLIAPFAGFAVLHDTADKQPTVWGVSAIMVRFAARKR